MRKGASMSNDLTLYQAIDQYQGHIDIYGTKGYANFTREQANALMGYFEPDRAINSINLNQMYVYIKAMQNKGLKNNTINKRLALLKRVVKHCEIDCELTGLKFLRSQFITYGRLSATELKTVSKAVDYLKVHEQLIYHVFKDTGIRVNELLHIKAVNVNLLQQSILLAETKTGQARTIYFTKETGNLFTRYFKANSKQFTKPGALLFYNLKTNREYVNMLFRRIKKLSGVARVSPHRLRHTLASDLYSNGCDILYISRLLGHCNLETTKRYILVNEDVALLIYEKFINVEPRAIK